MDMLKVEELKNIYTIKALEENYENMKTIDILITTKELIRYNEIKGTTTDELTFGEFTRRFERAMKDLETLLEN